MSLFDHALRLHREETDSPLPHHGEPYPDEESHHWQSQPEAPEDRRFAGAEAAAVLDAHFARRSAVPSDLANAFHDIYMPIHPSEHIAAAACRIDAQRIRETGRWLVRHATDRCATTIGLALLATVWDEEDIPLIQTIGLLSRQFGPLAAHALERRRDGVQALLWLAERVTGWGRVYVVESLCKVGSSAARPWLLRHACDGDFLNRYFAGKVATAAYLHEAIIRADPGSDVIDHTGRLLTIMADSSGMGMTLSAYPPADVVLEAYVGHVSRLEPNVKRYFIAAQLADYLQQVVAEHLGWPLGRRERILHGYLSLLDRQDWAEVARSGLEAGDRRITWLADEIAPRLGLRSFTVPAGD